MAEPQILVINCGSSSVRYQLRRGATLLLSGTMDGIGGDEPTVSDISQIIDHLFITGDPLPCVSEADVNLSGGSNPSAADVSTADIATLIDYLFITGSPLADCP